MMQERGISHDQFPRSGSQSRDSIEARWGWAAPQFAQFSPFPPQPPQFCNRFMRQSWAPVFSTRGVQVRRIILASVLSIQGGIGQVRFGKGWCKKKKKKEKETESSCSGQGGSATGHRSYLLTLPVLAAQSPSGWGRGWAEQRVRTCFCDVWGNPESGGGSDATSQQDRVHQGWQRACTFEESVPSNTCL